MFMKPCFSCVSNNSSQLEYVRQLSADKNNTVFGVVRNKATAKGLVSLNLSNVHVLEADVTDHKTLKVWSRLLCQTLFSSFLQAAASDVERIAGSLDYLINNAAWVDESRNGLTLDG